MFIQLTKIHFYQVGKLDNGIIEKFTRGSGLVSRERLDAVRRVKLRKIGRKI